MSVRLQFRTAVSEWIRDRRREKSGMKALSPSLRSIPVHSRHRVRLNLRHAVGGSCVRSHAPLQFGNLKIPPDDASLNVCEETAFIKVERVSKMPFFSLPELIHGHAGHKNDKASLFSAFLISSGRPPINQPSAVSDERAAPSSDVMSQRRNFTDYRTKERQLYLVWGLKITVNHTHENNCRFPWGSLVKLGLRKRASFIELVSKVAEYFKVSFLTVLLQLSVTCGLKLSRISC